MVPLFYYFILFIIFFFTHNRGCKEEKKFPKVTREEAPSSILFPSLLSSFAQIRRPNSLSACHILSIAIPSHLIRFLDLFYSVSYLSFSISFIHSHNRSLCSSATPSSNRMPSCNIMLAMRHCVNYIVTGSVVCFVFLIMYFLFLLMNKTSLLLRMLWLQQVLKLFVSQVLLKNNIMVSYRSFVSFL